jgi:hypothetical protein
MKRLIDHAKTDPPDKALQKAMLSIKIDYPNFAHWRSFTVFGMP